MPSESEAEGQRGVIEGFGDEIEGKPGEWLLTFFIVKGPWCATKGWQGFAEPVSVPELIDREV